MKKKLPLFILLSQLLFATNFSEMSTQELLAIIGYVKPQEQSKFLKELQSREKSMTKEEKEIYEKKIASLRR